MIEPGEIYMADLDVAGKHRIIVMSREDLNRGNDVLAVVCTSTRFAVRKTLANCVPFRAGQFGFTSDCVAQCENMLSVHKNQLDLAGGPVARLDDLTLRDVIKAVGYVTDSDCEPT
jgi:mRNA-degrading endonuclease toxin of MazEF toxin-antitoxin module